MKHITIILALLAHRSTVVALMAVTVVEGTLLATMKEISLLTAREGGLLAGFWVWLPLLFFWE